MPIVTSCQTLLPRFCGPDIPLFSFCCCLSPALCMMMVGRQLSAEKAAASAPTTLHASIPNCVSWSIKRKNIFTPVARRGGWITPSFEAPSRSQIYGSLRNSTTGKLCGSFYIHLGKDDIHGEICEFFKKKNSSCT